MTKTTVMQGRSKFDFPTIKTLKNINEVVAQKDLEASIVKRFKSNPAQQALVLVDQEKIAPERANSQLNEHAQFLTGDQSKQIGGELDIFKKNPL